MAHKLKVENMINVNWKYFESKYDKREQWAFENMSYFLFCAEFENRIGVFRYKNQTGIETEPIVKNGIAYGFQAKYYTTSISQNKADIIDSIRKAKTKNNNLNKILLYTNQELFESSKKTKKKPDYQIDIENEAQKINVEIEWRIPSHFEAQLVLSENKYIYDIFFGDNGLDQDFFNNQIEREIKNLGPRFNEKLNFELPIAKIFNSISKKREYYQSIITKTDKWLTEKRYRKLKDNELLAEIETELEALRQEIKDWIIEFQQLNLVETEITLLPLIDKIRTFDKKVSDKWHGLWNKQYAEKENKNKFDSELSRLREIQDSNREFIDSIDDLNINLANHPTLIIQGEAGCGKSHLLGDIATQRKNIFLPTVLLLGTTFNNSNTIEKNILNKLDLTCSFTDFLKNLNSIGLLINSRVLILIDAINEGAGADLWRNQIAGFIHEVAKYPAVRLVLTIRSTYFNDIIPADFNTNFNITIITHEGFKGNEYEALKLFCKHYDLKLPNFPILNPEFTNPLFLHTICEAVKSLPDKSFPKGFNGINKIYTLYKQSLNRKFEEKRHEYKNQDIVTLAIEKFAEAVFNSEYGQLECKDTITLFDNEFPRFPHLLSDLLEDCVFIKMRYEYSETPKDVIFFSYQKLGDFFIAEELLKPYNTKEEIKNAFVNDAKFRKITDQYQWPYRGIVETFSILLPEKYNLELFELINFFFEKNVGKRNRKWSIANTYESFTRILIDSLKWRNVNSINEKKIVVWVKKYYADNRYRYDDYLYSLTELTAIPNHPFNSDRLHRILTHCTMPERDSFWQSFLFNYSSYTDNKVAHPIRALIDWAWLPEISNKVDAETARLVAQALAWVLASTKNELRDQITKALVNLLEQQPDILIKTLQTFEKVDDLYILERLYAVAYGCILRTEKDYSIKTIAQYIYNTIFKNASPPIHILLRDYARNAIEYAIYRNVGVQIDMNLIRPPYNTKMPVLPQSEDEVKMYELDYDTTDFKQNYGFEHNAIYNSVIGGIADFGHYTVESKIDDFASFSFRENENYKNYLKTLKRNQREFIELLYECMKQGVVFHKNNDYQKRLGLQWTKNQQTYLDMLDSTKNLCMNELNNVLNQEQTDYVKETILPYFDRKLNKENFNPFPVRYWIVKRVFELGYDRQLHGEYDNLAERWKNYGFNYKIERIGKKYQWIALYEILAMLADNYKMKAGWRSDAKYIFYKGAWQNYLRNIDPAYITREKEDEEESDVKRNIDNWYSDEDYSNWNYSDSEWVKTTEDLIDPKQAIEKKDANGTEWLHLQHSIHWYESKKIGIDRYEGRRKQIQYFIQGLLVKKSDKLKIINYLKTINFGDKRLPENRDDHSELINREKFWSPAYLDIYKNNKKIWETIQDTKYKVIVATESANGGIEGDKSGANRSYNIPCKYIFEGMKLQYAPIDGNLKNTNDEIIVINSSFQGVLIRKKDLIQFIEGNGLDIIWTLLGEKLSYIDSRNEKSYLRFPCGVYYLEDGEIKGELKMYDRD